MRFPLFRSRRRILVYLLGSWVANIFRFSGRNKPAQKENGNQQTTKETGSDKVISHY